MAQTDTWPFSPMYFSGFQPLQMVLLAGVRVDALQAMAMHQPLSTIRHQPVRRLTTPVIS